MRFYIHYLPQYLAGLSLLAVHPRGMAWLREGARGELSGGERLLSRGLLLTCVVIAAVLVVSIPLGKASRVDHKGNLHAQLAGEYIAARSQPEDRVQVWGWAAWSVYFWADRKAPSRVFKVLGEVTNYNQNGMFARSQDTDFRPGPAADELLAAFRAAPPAFLVRMVPFFPGVKVDPLDQWPEMRALVSAGYVLRKRFGRVRVYEHRSRMTAKELKGRGRSVDTRSGRAKPGR